jgi:hypothetical protein
VRPKKKAESGQAATGSTPKPGDYELGSLQSRAAARAVLNASLKRILIVVSCKRPLNLQISTCERMLWPDGYLCEMVTLHGRASDLTDEQLEEFIARFPIRDDR